MRPFFGAGRSAWLGQIFCEPQQPFLVIPGDWHIRLEKAFEGEALWLPPVEDRQPSLAPLATAGGSFFGGNCTCRSLVGQPGGCNTMGVSQGAQKGHVRCGLSLTCNELGLNAAATQRNGNREFQSVGRDGFWRKVQSLAQGGAVEFYHYLSRSND